KGFKMKKMGLSLISLSILVLFLSYNMDNVFGTTYNMWLLNERQNIVYLSGVLFKSGIILFGFGVIVSEEVTNLKIFTLWTFLTPIILLISAKIFTEIKTNNQQDNLQVQETVEVTTKIENPVTEKKIETTAPIELTQDQDQTQESIVTRSPNTFIDNKNGTVTFKTSGLTWQQCAVGQNWTGTTCNGNAKKMNWGEAMKLTSNFAGYNDWHLPTKDELMTLVECSDDQYNQDGSCKNYNLTNKPTINKMAFPNTNSSVFWASSSFVNLSYYAWGVYFSSGHPYYYIKFNKGNVRLVRKQ
ncbi:MAG: DUF1566 domain-containing protein, partial [Methylococcales bacterium]|nr:DUF1566 domain-containing protein [Methylococcales bacterium]